jgi:hypothetical protein
MLEIALHLKQYFIENRKNRLKIVSLIEHRKKTMKVEIETKLA